MIYEIQEKKKANNGTKRMEITVTKSIVYLNISCDLFRNEKEKKKQRLTHRL